MSTTHHVPPSPEAGTTRPRNEFFNSRNYFILAAIGSAVGLGNIWRFPYVAYSNGGGAFILPYLIALLSAGIPLLFFDYAIGHRYRGSAPLALRRLGGRATEWLGWWQVLVCFVIAVYYAAIIAWAGMYTWFSVDQRWGDDPANFLFTDFLHRAETPAVGMDFVPGLLIPMLIVWVVCIGILALGVNKGISMTNVVFMPLLVTMFVALVVGSLFLPGAADGLDALFSPNWAALTDASVWAAAYGQIFFSLSVGFGIMLTYSSYLKRRTDLTGSGLVVGFANSSFELLSGIGVFAALGFMALTAGSDVSEVAGGGVGLAFVAFPTIISEAPWGGLLGVLFFGSLTMAGITSLISILEVIIAAVRDKLGLSRVSATLIVGIPMAVLSLCLLATTTGPYFLDITDEFVNKLGILAGAFAAVIMVAWVTRKLPLLASHLSRYSSFPVGKLWVGVMFAFVPVVLGFMVVSEVTTKLAAPYGGYPWELLGIYGWAMAITLVVAAIIISLTPWPEKPDFDENDNEHNQGVPV